MISRTLTNLKRLHQSRKLRRLFRRPETARRYLPLRGEHLEDRRVLTSLWQNPLFALDVNDDGAVAPGDVLIIINDINANRARPLPGTPDSDDAYVDVSGDGNLAPNDVLATINYLNARSTSLSLSLQLLNDSGQSPTDRITNDPRVRGTVVLNGTTASTARVRVNRGEPIDLAVDAAGSFVFDPRTAQSLSDGDTTVSVYLKDSNGMDALRQMRFNLDRVGIAAALTRIAAEDDTGAKQNDNITSVSSPRLQVSTGVGDHLRIELSGTVLFDGPSPGSFQQQFPLLADGNHQVVVTVSDVAGNGANQGFDLVVDTQPPAAPNLDLSPTSDTGVLGDRLTKHSQVALSGTTEANSVVSLSGLGQTTRTNSAGFFQLSGIPLSLGNNAFQLTVTDLAGNSRSGQGEVTRVTEVVAADPVLLWNQAVLDAILRDATAPPLATRAMAMVSLAMLDVVNAVDHTPAYLVSLPAPAGISTEAAVSAAAFRVLSYLFPGQSAPITAVHTGYLAGLSQGQSTTAGIAFGNLVGDAVIALRNQDGWDKFVDSVAGSGPGEWQPTAPMFAEALLPQWVDLTPLGVADPSALLPAGPPALSGNEWAAAYNEVKSLGRGTGSTRTSEQTEIARFWADGAGTYTPPGHWNQIASQFAADRGLSLGENARLFAMLNVALGDSSIAAWSSKYSTNFWRPITAIQAGDTDGNAATVADEDWAPLLITPPFPEYVSGHSTYSGAAAEILTRVFGDQQAFSTTSRGLPGVTRQFASFQDAAAEAGRSRIYGGIHYQFSNQDGQALGRAVAEEVWERFQRDEDTQAPRIIFPVSSTNSAFRENPEIKVRVLDNLVGVSRVQVRLDSSAPTPVTLGEDGQVVFRPTLPTNGSADGVHVATFTATDFAGNTQEASFSFTLDTRLPTVSTTSPQGNNAVLSATPRLTGSASGTGSPLVELCYQLDNGPVVPISFGADGTFDQPLDISRLSFGNHVLHLRAQDAAGNVTTSDVTVYVAELAPFQVSNISPVEGTLDVGSNFRPEVFFTRPVNPATLTTNSFYATDPAGQRLPATVVPTSDGQAAWLFLTNPLPSASTITLHVDGSLIKAAVAGTLLDGDGDGIPGGQFESTFSTVNLTPLPGTSLSGRIVSPGPDLKPMTFDDFGVGGDGVPYTADDVFKLPLAGVKLWVLGRESSPVFSAADGTFKFTSVPAGTIKVAVDGRTATNAPSGHFFPEMVMDLEIEAGYDNTMMGSMGTREVKASHENRGEVYLPLLANSVLKPVSSTQPTTVGVDGQSAPNLSPEQQSQLTLVVPPNSVLGADGKPLANPQVGISMVPPEFVRDMLPPDLRESHTMEITIQAPGATVFAIPIAISFPNLAGAAPGTQVQVFSFDHTTGLVIPDGTATVSADGLTVVSDPGSGIRAPGWHFLNTGTDTGNCKPEFLTIRNAYDVLKAVKACIGAIYNKAKKWLDLAEIFTDKALDLKDRIEEIQEAAKNGSTTADALLILISVLDHEKDTVVALFDALKESSPLGQLEAAIECAQAILSNLSSICERLTESGECSTLLIETVCFGIEQASLLLDGAVAIKNALSGALDEAVLFAVCTALDALKDFVATQAGAGGESPPSRVPVPAEGEPSNFHTELASRAAQVSAFLVQLLTKLDPAIRATDLALKFADRIDLVSLDAQKMIESHIAPREGYFVFKLGNSLIRGRLRNDEEIRARLPPISPFTLYVYDVASDRIATHSGTSSASGQRTRLPILSYEKTIGMPDADTDGLVDAAEVAVGTSTANRDTDQDGVDDLTELRQGSDPLGGRPVSTGIISRITADGAFGSIAVLATGDQREGLTGLISAGNGGLVVADLSDLTEPRIIGRYELLGDAKDLDVDSNSLVSVVASGAGGLHFFDVARPSRLVRKLTVNVEASNVDVLDGVAFASVSRQIISFDTLTGEQLQVVNISDGATITGIAHEGAFLYTMDADRVLRAFEVTDLGLVARGALQLTHGGGKISVANGIVYAAAKASFQQGGYATADVSNPNAIVQLSGSDVPAGFAAPGDVVVANGSGLALVGGQVAFGGTVLDLVDASDPAKTAELVTQFAMPAAPQGIAIANGIAYVAAGTGGLQVVNYVGFDTQGQAPAANITGPTTDFVQEGSLVPIRVTVTDDVQVSNVELLMDGQVVVNDVSAPWDLTAIAPTLASGARTVSFQVRATDTGGNVGLSNVLTYNLSKDVTPPALIGSSPANGSAGFRVNVVSLRFNEPIDPARLNLSNVTLTHLGANNRLGGGDDTLVALDSIESPAPRRAAIRTVEPLPEGVYQLSLGTETISDLGGNTTLRPIVLTFTSFDLDEANAVAWISDTDGDWNNSGNWSTGKVPGPNDAVIIDRKTANPKVTLSSGSVSVKSLVSREEFRLTGGSLLVAGSSQIDGRLQISNGATLTASGPTATFTALGETAIDGAQFIAANGGQIRLPNAFSFTNTFGNVTWRATGSGSILDLPNLSAITHHSVRRVSFNIEVITGGTLRAPLLTQFADPNVDTNGRTFNIRVEGAGSRLELDSLLNLQDVTSTDYSDCCSFTEGMSNLVVKNGGTIVSPLLNVVTGFQWILDGTGEVDLRSLRQFQDGRLILSGFDYVFDQLVDATGLAITITGRTIYFPMLETLTSGILSATSLGSAQLPNLKDLRNGQINLQSAGTAEVPMLSQIDGTTLLVTGGTSLDLPGVRNYTNTLGSISWRASGVGSVLNLPNLSGITQYNGRRINFGIEALTGGRILLPKVNQFADPNTDTSGRTFSIRVEGAGSTLDVTALTNLQDVTSGDYSDCCSFTEGMSNLTVRNGGVILAPNLRVVTGFEWTLDGTGLISLESVQQFLDGRLVLSGQDFSFGSLNSAVGVSISVTGRTVSFPQLVNLTSGGLSVSNVGTVQLPALQDLRNGKVSLQSGGIAVLPVLSQIDGSSFDITSSTILSLPGVINYTNSVGNLAWRVSGNGSVLDMPNLTGITQYNGRRVNFALEVLAGGKLLLPKVTQLSDPNTDTSGRVFTVLVEGAGSTLDLTQLTNLQDVTSADYSDCCSFNEGMSTLVVRNGGAVLSPRLQVVNGFHWTLDGTGSVGFDEIQQFQDGRLQLSGMDFTFGKLANASGVIVSVSGRTATFPELTTLSSGGLAVSNQGTAQLPVLQDLRQGQISLQSGGNTNLPMLTQVDGTNISVLGGTPLSLPAVTNFSNTVGSIAWRTSGKGSDLSFPNLTGITHYSGRRVNFAIEALAGGKIILPQVAQFSDPSADSTGRTFNIVIDGSGSAIEAPVLANLQDVSSADYSDCCSFTEGLSTLVIRNGGQFLTGPQFARVVNFDVVVQSGGQITGTVEIDASAILRGDGTIAGSLRNRGDVRPGNSPGRLQVSGDYTQFASGRLSVEVGGTAVAVQYDQLVVLGQSILDGTLAVTLTNGFVPAVNDSFVVLQYGTLSGTFPLTTGLSLSGGKLLVPTYSATNLTLTTGQALQLASGNDQGTRVSDEPTVEALNLLRDAALSRWVAAGLSGQQVRLAEQVRVEISDLGEAILAVAYDGRIIVSRQAAGAGWFLDQTPEVDEEYWEAAEGNDLQARANGPADQRVDLLSVLEHELGHLFGLEHTDQGVLNSTLARGTRRKISPQDVDAVLAEFGS